MGASAESAGSGMSSGSDAPLDTAKTAAGDAKETASDAVAAVREKSGNMQAGIANWLDQSAQVIRDRARAASAAVDGASASGTESVQVSPQLANVAGTAAGVLERSAMWLRENDLTELETRVTEQVKARPVQSLLIAAGIGFLLSRGKE